MTKKRFRRCFTTEGCHYTHHNNLHHNDTQPNKTKMTLSINESWRNDTRRNDTLYCVSFVLSIALFKMWCWISIRRMSLSWVSLCISVITLSVIFWLSSCWVSLCWVSLCWVSWCLLKVELLANNYDGRGAPFRENNLFLTMTKDLCHNFFTAYPEMIYL
jgi:hypothetical protein